MKNKEPYILNKLFQHIGLLCFATYLIFACFYYQERTLFLDNPFQVFLMIFDGEIAINADRWPAVIVRFIPYLLIELQWSLKWVLLSFSLSYILYHFIIFYVIRYKLRDRSLALLQLATITLPIVHSFFWCNSEQNLAVSLLILTLALFKQQLYVLTGIFCFILLWMHPLVVLPFGFVMSLYTVERFKNKENKKALFLPLVFAFLFCVGYILKAIYFKNWYDTMKSNTFVNNLSNYDFFQLDFVKDFCFGNYWLFPVFTLLAISYLLYKREIIKGGLFIIFILGYLLMLDISSFSHTSFVFYNEVNYLITFFAAAFVLQDFIRRQRVVFQKLVFIVFFILVVFNWISNSSFYTQRIEWYKNFAKENDRTILDLESVDEIIVMPWASAYESLLITTLESQSSTVVVTDKPKKYDVLNSEKLFLAEFKTYNLEDINHTYFNLSKQAYKSQ